MVATPIRDEGRTALMRFSGIFVLAALLLVSACTAMAIVHGPDALWVIVHDECVPDEQQHHDPSPCTLVDLRGGYVVLEVPFGGTQYLVMPTARVTGIE